MATEDKQRELLSYLETQDFLTAASNATRLVAKLVTAVQKRELYDTHQLLRTLYFRFSNHRSKLKPLADLLYHGAKFLAAHKENISCQDVATLCLEISAKMLQARWDDARAGIHTDTFKLRLVNSDVAFHRTNDTIDFDVCNKIAKLAIDLPDSETGRSKYVAEATKLLTPKILNRELFHTVLAQTFKTQLDYVEARYHFLHCTNLSTASEIANLLAEYHHYCGNKNEVDLFLAQFVLQFLCIQTPSDVTPASGSSSASLSASTNNKSRSVIRETAESIIHNYKRAHLQLVDEPTPSKKYPLFNFLNFITAILDATKPETQTFKALCEIYQTIWERDPNYQSYLNRIGVLYFGMIDQNKQQQQRQQGGFFNNILMSLLDDSEDDEESNSELESSANMTPYDDLD